MKSGKSICMLAALACSGAFLIRGELETWVQHVPAGPALSALFREVPMPGGAVPVLRPPAETRPALSRLISGTPTDAMLYRLRAQEAEQGLDFTAAEADWKIYAQRATDRYAGRIDLADFYHRRVRPRDELDALNAAATAKDDPLEPATAQLGWRAFERMAALAVEEDLPPAVAEPVFRAWVARYRAEPAAWRKLIDYLSAHREFAAAETEIGAYGRAFHDDFEPVRMRAELEMRRGRAQAAMAVYDRALEPLWPDGLRAAYFKLLEGQGGLREFGGRARIALAANPADLDATARLFHYFKAQNNAAAARRALLEYRRAKESGRAPWKAGELETLAQLFEWLPDANEAARMYYALYSVPPAGGTQAERALYGLANLLLTAADQPIQFGSGDLSFYKDIATVDPSPGFLNGILSLVLNTTGPRRQYEQQNEKSAAYFHRAAAAQLVTLLEQRFPQSPHRELLRAELISAYAGYGDDASVIRAGREYLAAFPVGAARVPVALQMADARARGDRANEEFALYDQLLRELAAKASGRPVRSAEYVQVLDKYLSRLAALKRPLEALRVYRTEIGRNPNDAGLYERLGAFLEQNGMSREVEAIYTQAIARFADRSWYHKLARWYLRRKESSALEKISRDAIAVFSGSQLEGYFTDIVTQGHPDAALYRQLNLFAHARFPDDLAFVHNLLNVYRRAETHDDAAADRLLRQYWFYDPQFRSALFERLAADGRLASELREIRAANPGIEKGQFDQALAANPAAVQFVTEAEIWQSHFEAAAPAARAIANAYPGRREATSQAVALYRSLAADDPRNTEIAAHLAGYEQRADPRDAGILAKIGDIFADRELFTRSRAFWERMPQAQPGKPEAYLDAATIYWDYYRYNDALRWIAAARKKFHDPALFAYQAGAIYESKRDDAAAVREYIAGALHGENAAQHRLLRLLNRPQTRQIVERATAAAIASDPSPQAVRLRIDVLEAQQRRPDLEALLQSRVDAEKSSAELSELQETTRRLGFDAIEERAGERLAAITSDPVDKMRLTLANVRLLEAKKDLAGAARIADALYRDHPLILGVLRGAVDFHVRNGQPDAAMAILLDAAKQARADLAAQFTLEAARISTKAGQVDRARTLLSGLLSADPLHADYLAAMANTYLQAKDDGGFRDYQLATIQRLKQFPERIAAIRRSLIPALDRLHDSAGAADQYIEVVNSYPEDDAITKEAAAYGVAHGQATRMLAFYRKTVANAPRDYRWPIVLGRIETAAEDFPAAIAAYERAIQARPDRADVLQAKARLEERLMRFDDAMRSYTRLYELAYRDPQYMIKVAELRARSGESSGAVSALKAAIIGARTETADADFTIAERLESWHILPDAMAFAERGARLAGPDLLKDAEHAVVYARIMARARRMEAVLTLLGSDPGADQQVAQAAGKIVDETYTPAEKARFAEALDAAGTRVGPVARQAVLLPLVQASGLVDLEARWRYEAMLAQKEQVDPRFVTLQSRRALYGELGRELEEYAAQNPGRSVEGPALDQAVRASIAEGDIQNQMRVMAHVLSRNALSGDLLDRYLRLLAAREPEELLAIIGGRGSADIRNRAVQFAIAGEQPGLAYRALRVRGNVFPPVWTRAYTALAGEYFDDRSPAIDTAFQSALDTRTIGERLRLPLKTDSVIAGSVWFFYGARYGDYLLSGKNAAAKAWLPASLESAPANPGAYIALGDAYAKSGQGAKAVEQFEHALELDQDRGDAHDRIARVLWLEGRRPEAMARWKSALATFQQIQSRGVRVPEPFWGRVAETFTDIGERHAFGELRGEIGHLLSDYFQRNNAYRLQELIEPAAHAALISGEGLTWLLDLTRGWNEPDMILSALSRLPDLTDAQRISLQRDGVAIFAKSAEAAFGDDREWRFNRVSGTRIELASMLLKAGDIQGASREWRQVPAITTVRSRLDRDQLRDEVEIRLASKIGELDALLERYRTQPDTAPPADNLRNAALALRTAGDENAARTIFEFLYDREIRNGNLAPSNFLGLAEVKLQRGNTAEAVALMNRMTLVIDDEFDSLLPAAELLNKFGQNAAAVDFIRRRLKAAPWDTEAKVQLARALSAGSPEREQLLAAAAADAQTTYKLRAEAIRLSAAHPAGLRDGAEKPYDVEARIDAAHAAPDPAAGMRYWLEALAIAPTDERIRLGALRAAIALRRDSLALALAPAPNRSDAEHNALLESLAAAAERLDELATAQDYLRAAIVLRPEDLPDGQRDALARHLKEVTAEQQRRANNAARQPAIRNAIEQDRIVRPRILRSAQ